MVFSKTNIFRSTIPFGSRNLCLSRISYDIFYIIDFIGEYNAGILLEVIINRSKIPKLAHVHVYLNQFNVVTKSY